MRESIAGVVFHDLQDTSTAKAPQWLGIGVLAPSLRQVERIADRLDLFWKS